MLSLPILVAFLVFGICLAMFEFQRHQVLVRGIPHRIHVNGSRGKSSVTRLIGAGLRAGGVRTLVKVTGTFPRLILEDGQEVHVYRRGDPNILEQLDIARFANHRQVEALVIECMALQPENQRITEQQMIHATVGVITNVRLDHTDIMGRTPRAIARTMGGTIPRGGVLYSSEDNLKDYLTSLADAVNCETHFPAKGEVSAQEIHRFSYLEHRENVALALTICERLGVDRGTALEGMIRTRPDAGVLSVYQARHDGKQIDFFNAFAANDPDSTLIIWKKLEEEQRLAGQRMVLLNNRHDRRDRSEQLVDMLVGPLDKAIDRIVLMGTPTEAVARMLTQSGIQKDRIVDLGDAAPPIIHERLFELTGQRASVVAIGNMGGQGAHTADYFANQEAGDVHG